MRSGRPPFRAAGIGVVVVLVVLAVIGALAPKEPEPVALTSVLGLGPSTATDPAPERMVTSAVWGPAPADRVVILLAEGLMRADADKIASQLGAKIVGEIAYFGLYQLETQARTAADLDAAVTKAAQIPGVAVALADQIQRGKDIQGTRCDPLADPSYQAGANGRAYEMIGLRGAWDVIAASGVALSDVRVAVLDRAYYSPAGEFNKGGPKLTGDTTTTQFKDAKGVLKEGGLGHGTSVAHMLAADPENGGVAGVGGVLGGKLSVSVTDIYRAGDTLVPMTPKDPNDPRFVSADGQTYLMRTFADAVKQIDAGATVINASFGPDKPDPKYKLLAQTWRTFLTRMAKDHPNVVFVAAAGNEQDALDGANYSIGGHPLPNLITVGSVDSDGKRSWFSNYATTGGEVTLATNGNNVMVGIGPDGKPVMSSGTSFATPQVAGAAALLRSIDPDLTAKQIKDVLVSTGSPGVLTKDANGKEISALVPKEIGGRVMRVDEAVLKVVNDVRKKRDPKAKDLTLAQLRAFAVIDVKAVQRDPVTWTIVAQVPGVPDGGADVTVEFSGQASIGGLSTKRATTAGPLEWPLIFPTTKDSASVTVRRLDTKACARVGIKAAAEVAASPTAAGPKGTVESALVAALRKLGLPTTKKTSGSSDPAGGYMCQSYTDNTGTCTFSRWIQQNSSTTSSGDALELRIESFPTPADAEARTAGGFDDGHDWVTQTYRGLSLRSYVNDDYNYGDGLWQGPHKLVQYRVAVGRITLDLRSDVGCTSRTDLVKSCAMPSAGLSTGTLDAFINEVVAAGLAPAGSVR